MYRVVVADDEMLIKRTLKKLIEYENSPFTVIGEAEDGGEALEWISVHRPELVITDIRMPVLDGLELISEARSRAPETIFVIISGHDDFSYAQQALRFGVADYLLKPIKPDQLREVLDKVEASLDQINRSELERRDRLWFIKSRAEVLADALWLLNGESLTALLDDLHREFSSSKHGLEGRAKGFWLDLLSFVNGALEEKSSGTILLFGDKGADLSEDPDALRGEIESLFTRKADEIRQSRNWQSHHNMKRTADYLKENYSNEKLSFRMPPIMRESLPHISAGCSKRSLASALFII
ncbi:response regulator [Paenibacillus sp. CC-CFT747]|nr:response regulator [Paenibacillus sp. CC-CFT747]